MPVSSSNLRYAWRSLARTPAFTIAAVLSLGLGIGANTGIFTLADQMLLRALPVKQPHRLVSLEWNGRFIGGTSRGLGDTFAYPMYTELRDANPGVFTGIAARYQTYADLAHEGPAQRVTAELVSGNFFDVLGVNAIVGRTLTAEDDRTKDAEPYVVFSYDYWQREFAGDPAVLNRPIDVNGRPMTVVGVAQKGFRGYDALSPSDVFIPMMMKRVVTPTWDDLARRNSIWLKIFARLAPGVAPAAAQTAMQVVYHRTLENDLAAVSRNEDFRKKYLANTISLRDASKGFGRLQQSFAKPLRMLMLMVGVLLLIACVNVANLLITRSAARQKEIAIRLSIGATRWSLIRLIMTESLCIAVAGGVVGVILSSWVASFLVRMLPLDNIATAINTTPDWRILAFAAAVSAVTAVLFGIAPAVQTSRPDLSSTLKNESGTISMAAGQARMRKVLVVAQVTLSLLLLVGAGLFARSLYHLFSVDAGVKTDSLLAFTVDPSLHTYTPARARTLFQEIQAALGQTPAAIAAAGASFPILASNGWENTVNVEGYRRTENEDMQAGWNQVLPGFFSTMGVALIGGREFNDRDVTGGPKVVIVDETFVKRFYPHENPLGRHVGFGGPPDMEIVGIVKPMKGGDLRENPKPYTYTPVLQQDRPSAITFYVRSGADPRALAQGARQAVARLDSSLPLYDLKTLRTQINETHFMDRIFAALSAAFGVLATLLASVGLYGVTAYTVARRRQEIGIRVALGARRADVLRLVFREVVLLTTAGVALGIPLALGAGRMIESALFGVRGADPAVLAAAVIVIAVVSAISGYLPARRAARIDPLRALRYE